MLAPGDLLGFFPPLPLIFPFQLTVSALTEGSTSSLPPFPPPVLLHGLSLAPPLDPPLHPIPEKEVPQGAQGRVMTSTAVKIGGRYVIEINSNSHDNKPGQICI